MFEVTLGHSPDNTIVLQDPEVSSHHARVLPGKGGLLLEDQGSTNGIYVNGVRQQRATIRPGDYVTLGRRCPFPWSHPNIASLLQALAAPQAASGAGQSLTMGSSPQCSLFLDFPQVSSQHARLTPLQDGTWLLEDLGSTNGTYVNDRYRRITTPVKVGLADIIYLGSVKLPLGQILSQGAARSSAEISVDKEEVFIGRSSACDIALNYPQVTARHARIRKAGNKLVLEDLGSTNGTFVNGQRIRKRVLEEGDRIQIASHEIRLNQGLQLFHKGYKGEVQLEAHQLAVVVPTRQGPKALLQDVSFVVYPSELVGLMGASGAGKTTLLMALNGYLRPSQGLTMINGQDVSQNFDRFRYLIGYVPQDDIIHRELTVQQALYYTAKLRLPKDYTEEQIQERISQVLRDLDIDGIRDVLIGSAERKGISGGQRKRVNLAMELLTSPPLLFLDEPTSGLSATDTKNVMALLRRLADEGRTLVLTIHQPSLQAYQMMDNVIILDKGKLCFYGPTFPDSLRFFNPQITPGSVEEEDVLSDADSALDGLARQKNDVWIQRYRQSEQHRRFVAERQTTSVAQPKSQSSPSVAAKGVGVRQWLHLTRRCLTVKLKDTASTGILFSQAPIIGALVALVFSGIKNIMPTYFLLAVASIWFGCSNSAREIVGERAIYNRERMVNLKIPSYVLSKFAVLGVLCMVQCVIMLGIVYPVLDMEGDFLEMLVILILSALGGLGMGLSLSSLVRSQEAAVALVPILLIPQIVVGGTMLYPVDMKPAIRTISSVMIARWAFEGVLQAQNEDGNKETRRDLFSFPQAHAAAKKGAKKTAPAKAMALDEQQPTMSVTSAKKWCDVSVRPLHCIFGKHKTDTTTIMLVLMAFVVGLVALTMIILRFRKA